MAAPATNTQTTLAYHMIPARTLHIHVAGCGEWTAGGKLTFSLYNQDGSNLLIATNNNPALTGTADKFTYDGIIYVTCYTADAGGTCRVSGNIKVFDQAGSLCGGWGFYCASALSLDTTVTHKWRVTANFDTNTNYLHSNTVNIINVA